MAGTQLMAHDDNLPFLVSLGDNLLLGGLLCVWDSELLTST